MVKLIAAQRLPYGKNHHAVGDEFDASDKDARLLVKIGKATYASVKSPADLPKAVFAPQEPAPDIDIPALRGEYETVVGKRPFNGWTADVLSQKIAEHQASGTYLRRDMRAED